MQEKKIIFEIGLEEANLIFKALGKLPFVEVYELIGKLNDQANGQLQLPDNHSSKNEKGIHPDK